MKPLCILFAGPIGSGKTPIANYLSYKLNLPILNNDAIRSEVQADLLRMDQEEYIKRRTERLGEILESKKSFIYDASIDREWVKHKSVLVENGYNPFIVSIDLSKEKLLSIYEAKGNTQLDHLDRTIKDHQNFVKEFGSDISISVTDENFQDRLKLVLEAVMDFQGDA